MTAICHFVLNRQFMSALVCDGGGSYFAYSGNGGDRNQPSSTVNPGSGPLPVGEYFIVDRESGGRFGTFRDHMQDVLFNTYRAGWFALYRNDGVIDDYTFVSGVRRGNFRLHPAGRFGVSEGCITLADPVQYYRLWSWLKDQKKENIPGTAFSHYGKVKVR